MIQYVRDKLYSRTTFPIDALVLSPPSATDTHNKPRHGYFLWASGAISTGRDITTEWDRYVEAKLHEASGKYSYLLEITPNWNSILSIGSEREYLNFYKNNKGIFIKKTVYVNEEGDYADVEAIDFSKLSNMYSGIYISDPDLYDDDMDTYLISGRNKILGFNKYSVETLVLWSEDGIKKLKMYHVKR